MERLGRGVTSIKAVGMYSKEEKNLLILRGFSQGNCKNQVNCA